MPILAKELVRLYNEGKTIGWSDSEFNSASQMYGELLFQPTNITFATATATATATAAHARTPNRPVTQQQSWFPSFFYVDNSLHLNTNNTTKHPEKKKNLTLEEILLQVVIVIGVTVTTAIAAISFGYLAAEIGNHASRIYHNESMALGFALLSGVLLSYCLAMITLYAIAGGLLMAAMTAAAFSGPAGWAAAVICLGALIATPVFNMFIREGIYTLFSSFTDSQSLVAGDSRFMVVDNQATEDRFIDPDRANFAILHTHEELKLSDRRQRFAWFDTNSQAMNLALQDVRKIRSLEHNSIEMTVERGELRNFSLEIPIAVVVVEPPGLMF